MHTKGNSFWNSIMENHNYCLVHFVLLNLTKKRHMTDPCSWKNNMNIFNHDFNFKLGPKSYRTRQLIFIKYKSWKLINTVIVNGSKNKRTFYPIQCTKKLLRLFKVFSFLYKASFFFFNFLKLFFSYSFCFILNSKHKLTFKESY